MRKGLHPLLHSVRFVMKNGASFRCNIVSKKADPVFLQADVTTHPTWTKEKSGLTLEVCLEPCLSMDVFLPHFVLDWK